MSTETIEFTLKIAQQVSKTLAIDQQESDTQKISQQIDFDLELL